MLQPLENEFTLKGKKGKKIQTTVLRTEVLLFLFLINFILTLFISFLLLSLFFSTG
jgi:hypothetical protein